MITPALKSKCKEHNFDEVLASPVSAKTIQEQIVDQILLVKSILNLNTSVAKKRE